jgi:hypothetical protein
MEKEPPIRLTHEIKSKMSTLVFHLLFNHSKTSTKKMAFNVLSWDIQFVSKFGFIILLEIPKETKNCWVNILGVERVWDVHILIASVSFMIWVILIQTTPTLPWKILIFQKKGNKKMKMLELNITAQFPCMTLEDITNALTEKSLPLSDNIDGLYKMMPPELLHTSGSGLIMYMFESLRDQMGCGKNRDFIDQWHIQISNLIKAKQMWFSKRIN